ncbi:DEAD/DEAH box helicase family protein [Gordonia sp. (in: high G+C Gram-positive bacteria)]|uniref:DEAD/DEAH box helicase n=1 Tax=Gordonia sp. (in: high G+C Gram-positive bacteria) TaxID=84139 RepID=UPI003C773861
MTSSSGLELRAWQRDAFESWVAAGRRAVVEAVTGTGKTVVGIVAVADAVARGRSVLVVVPGVALLEQWYDAVVRALPAARVGRRGAGAGDDFTGVDILISTVQSAISTGASLPGRPATLVADEVHRYGAASFSRFLTEDFEERLGLTATFERNDNGVQERLLPYFQTLIPGCDYPRAQAEGILAPVRVMLVEVPFAAQERAAYDELDEIISREQFVLTRKHACREEPFGEFMQDVTALSEDGGGQATWSARRYLSAFSKRRAVLAESRGKLDTLSGIGGVLASGGRSIVFSETKESAKASSEALLAQGVVAAPYTSDLSTDDRSELLDLFKQGAVTTLAAPRVLDEGVDVPEADVGIILAGSRTRRQMIQRLGRIIRPKADGRHASFVVLYVGGSSEDPARGAHGTFLDQLTEIATEVITVDAEEAPDRLAGWLTLRGALAAAATSGRIELVDRVLTSLSVLPLAEVEVLLHRLGIGGHAPASIDDTARAFALTVEEVQTLEARALDRLSRAGAQAMLSDPSAILIS